jgi:hypothetical protein
MARFMDETKGIREADVSPVSPARVWIGEECIEFDAASPDDVSLLRQWIRRVNGSAYAQPFLAEGPPGHFRLYVGEAAERVRTQRGMQ